ncbi:T-complex protein 1 subunit beta [Camellia lanceoleosa]|uniref:T-complex protein 1 subunit beta n=1 Tax=Camellia lanceoleosa TaxID=1840588 RepID=A0ACC0HRK3_9ERIC|nr:T-complex protein 1 subunit beta [Camellia lanceoleosa]
MAAECARNGLLQKVMDNKEDADLMKIAMTTLSSKILSQDEEHFANLAVDSVMRLQVSNSYTFSCFSWRITNLEAIKIIKKPGGSLKDSFLGERFILDKKIGIGLKHIENAKILVANTTMDTDKVKIYGARVRVDSMSRVAEIEGAEKEKMREKVQKIIGLGINCFVNRQLIYNFLEELFAHARILAIEHADFDGIEHLARVTGVITSLMKLKGLYTMPCVCCLRWVGPARGGANRDGDDYKNTSMFGVVHKFLGFRNDPIGDKEQSSIFFFFFLLGTTREKDFCNLSMADSCSLIDPELVISHKFPETTHTYTER